MRKFVLSTVLIFSLAIGAVAGSIPMAKHLDSSLWQHSKWISVVDAPVVTGKIRGTNIRSADGASWFMTSLTNEQKVVSAKWMATSLGVHDIYVNGTLVGEEVLKPGFTHYKKTKISFTYDVTSLMDCKAGAVNVFSAQVTPGWWADKVVTPGNNEGMNGKKCAFRGVLELKYSDGSVKYLGTDLDNWKAGIAGPVTHAAIFDGESYDARIRPGYETPDKLSRPEINTEFGGEIVPSNGAEVYYREDLRLDPVLAYVWEGVEGASDDAYGKVVITRTFKPGAEMNLSKGETLVVDFGQNAAAVPSFVFKAAEGTLLTCLPSEILNDGNGARSRGMDGPEGSCHRLNLRIPQEGMRLEYTFAGTGKYEEYTPRRTFFGYRYVSITATDDVQIKSISSLPVTSVTKDMETGTIATGHAGVNQLISNVLWGMYSNYLSVPTDCPQRNERIGWAADTHVFAETGTFFANTSSFLHKWMRDMMDSQYDNGAYPGVAPLSSGGWAAMRLGWSDAGIIVPWIVWKQTGNVDILRDCWDSMERYMAHVRETKYEYETIRHEAYNNQYADWLSYEPLESYSRGAHYKDADNRWQPKKESLEYWNYLAQSYWLIDAVMMRDMARALGKDTEKYEDHIKEVRGLLMQYFNPDGTFRTDILNTMQTPVLFALRNGLLEGKAKEDMIVRLRENFRQHGNCLQTGFLGTSILLGTLTDNGMVDVAYELLFQRKNPSWLYSVDNGATTIWERWNSYMKESGMGPRGMNSFNHYAYGCVCEWIWETAAGISCDPSGAGFSDIVMKPVPDKRLGFVEAEYPTPAGLVKSAWKYKGDKWIWKFTVPKGAVATVTLPGESDSKKYAPGTYKIEKLIK